MNIGITRIEKTKQTRKKEQLFSLHLVKLEYVYGLIKFIPTAC